jgi:signal transduction histidine kinase
VTAGTTEQDGVATGHGESGLVALERRIVAAVRDQVGRRPLLSDGAIMLLIGAFTLARHEHGHREHGSALLLGVLLVLPLILRRRWPLGVFAFLAVVAAVQWLFSEVQTADAALLFALYTVAAHDDRRRAVAAAVVLELGVVMAVVRWVPARDALSTFVLLSGMVTAAFVLGVNLRTRRALLASLEDRALRAERERDQQSQIAAAEERALIAREMHDIVAHNLSVMIALADGAAFAARTNAVQAEAAARHVSATGRQALDEMHRLLGVLRGSGAAASFAPQPGIGQIDELVTQVRAAGLPTSWTVEGQPFPLSSTAGLATYRVVQEALTNVLKHADEPKQARVTLRYADPIVDVEVVDDGRNTPTPVAEVVSVSGSVGHGLSGMRERVAVFGGRITAGARPGGGWRVHATLDSGRPAPEVSR